VSGCYRLVNNLLADPSCREVWGMVLRGSTSCAPRSRNCISCVPNCPFQVYQLHPELSTLNMTSCIPRLPRNRISCIEVYGYTKCPAIWRFLQFYCSLLYMNYMNTYRIVEWYRLCTVVSCYGL